MDAGIVSEADKDAAKTWAGSIVHPVFPTDEEYPHVLGTGLAKLSATEVAYSVSWVIAECAYSIVKAIQANTAALEDLRQQL